MINNLRFALTLVSALGFWLTAGVFFAFSVFVMKALASLPPAQGIAAMQTINVTVPNPWLLGTFFGTAVACILLACGSIAHRCAFLAHDPRRGLIIDRGPELYCEMSK
jgi:uncharacterized membrane protein